MVRSWYYYALAPIVLVVGTAVLLTIPYLALIALLLVSVGVFAALGWAVVLVPLTLGRAVKRRLRRRGGMTSATAVALAPTRQQRGRQGG